MQDLLIKPVNFFQDGSYKRVNLNQDETNAKRHFVTLQHFDKTHDKRLSR